MLALFLSGCSATKFVPEGSYLLKSVQLKSDDKTLDATSLDSYIRQRANSKWFSLFKIPLGTYALAGRDSTRKLNRFLWKIGEQPVIFDSLQANLSCNDLRRAMQNMGYMHASASLAVKTKGKKLKAVYTLHPRERFYIGKVRYDIKDDSIAALLRAHNIEQQGLRTGMPFSVDVLNGERKRLTTLLANSGYYRFHRDFIQFRADSALHSNTVDLTLELLKYRANTQSPDTLHPRYFLRQIQYQGNEKGSAHLRSFVLRYNTMLSPGDAYNNAALLQTYQKFARLQAIRYTNIKFEETPDTTLLDCNIQLSPNKVNTLSFQPEGTNTAGDLGAAASVTFENRNLFHGSEVLSIRLRGAFEAITRLEGYKDKNYQEYNIDTKLSFPRFVAPFLSYSFKKHSNATSELSLRYDLQNRPEFHRRVFSTAWRYRWAEAKHQRSYRFDLVDIDYVYMPWISETFKRDYLDNAYSRNAILRYNYQDLFIVKTGFGIHYNDGTNAVKVNIETAGNLMNLVSHLSKAGENAEGRYTLFKIAYAQYAKGDADYTRLIQFDDRNALALHVGLGIAYPYGNSKILPFEKRYFSGGANSVRGWSVRSLGPGRFRGSDARIDFINQTGDLRLDLNAEYRTFLFWKLNGAVFLDAGNIWTLRPYEEQEGGQFQFHTFYKQIAVAYGIGFRLNFDYFILRFDIGMKAVNPAYQTAKEHYPLWHPRLKRDMAFHFAVGLPF